MITTNLDAQTNAIHPAMVACFAKSIISIIQDNITLYEVKIKVGTEWEEKRRPIVANGESVVKFDLQYIARAIMQQRDMFGLLSSQSSNERRSQIIDFEIIVTPDQGDTPFSKTISLPCFFGSYLIGETIQPRYEHIYLYMNNGSIVINQYINLPIDKYIGDRYSVQREISGTTLMTIDPRVNPMYNMAIFSQYDDILIYCSGIQDTDQLCNSVWGKTSIYIHKRETCGRIFRFINNRGLIRYVSLRISEETESTKATQSIKFDLFEQPILQDGSFIDHRIKQSDTTKTLKFVEQSIDNDFLPLYKDFCKSSFVQIADVKDSNNVYWRNVTLSNTSIKQKRKDLLTDVSVSVIIDTENNIY